MPYLKQEEDGTVSLFIYVQPKASRNQIAGLHDVALKITTTAPPLEGKANAAIIKMLAKLFKIPQSSITVRAGMSSRKKRLSIANITLDEARKILSKQLNP